MPGIGADETPLSPATYFTYRDESRAFEDIALYKRTAVTVTGLVEPERVGAMLVTDGLFPLLGVSPILGRGYGSDDVSPGSAYPVILSHGFWQRRFGGDPDILGRIIRLTANDLEIVGGMPPDFRMGGDDPALYLPLVLDRSRVRMGNYSFPGVARLNPGVTVEAANRDVARLIAVAVERFGGKTMAELEDMDFRTIVRPLKEEIIGGVGTVLWVLFGAVSLVLLVACANVANLFLVRAENRRREMAMRTAIGASRGRITRQLLTESLVMGILGGAAGLGLAYAALRLILTMAPANLPRLAEIAIEPPALVFTLTVSALAGLLFGLIPVLQYGRPVLVTALKEGGPGAGTSGGRHCLRNSFAVAQIALALVLLVGSGLMIRTFQVLRNVRPGFERPEEVLTLRLAVPSADAPEAEGAMRMHESILERLAAIPGVASVSAGTSVAMSRWESWDDVHVEGRFTPEGQAPTRRLNWIAPDYFTTLQNPLLAGRAITWDDIHNRRPVVMVSENLAREYWGEPVRALGKRISENPDGPWREIVGVVGNVYTRGVDHEPPTVVYFPFMVVDFWGSDVHVWRNLRYAIRVAGPEPKSLLPQVRRAVWSVNPNIPLADVRTLEEIRADSMARTQFTLVMLGLAAAVALLLGTIGVFGVISYVVSKRIREFGVRIAVGARGGDISRLVLRHGGLVGVIGIAIGLAAAVGLTRLMSALLFGVSPLDPPTYALVSLVIIAVVALASYVPARRAASVDPAETLRWE
jgi:predicted permease